MVPAEYSLRFIDLMSPSINESELAFGIQSVDAKFTFLGKDVFYDGVRYGKIEVLRAGSEAFKNEVQRLLSYIAKLVARGGNDSDRVDWAVNAITDATAIVVLHAIWPETLELQKQMFERFDPVLHWLELERGGISHVDEGPFNIKDETILS